MKKIVEMFLWLAVSIALTGCIVDFTPKESVIELEPGEPQTFKAVSDDPSAKLVWYLDNQKVAYGQNTYTYTAEANTGEKPIVHKLVVREEGGKYVQYYKIAGLPKNFMSSVIWIIKVLPQQAPDCEDGETRETTCGVGACAATGIETCTNGAFTGDTCVPGNPTTEIRDGIDNDCDGEVDEGVACSEGETRSTTCGVGACAATGIETCVNGQFAGNTCVPGTPSDEVCDAVDNNCNGTVDDGIASTPTTCGVGACASSGLRACVNGQIQDSCVPGSPNAEVCDGIDNNCNGTADDGIAATPTTCGVGACQSTGQLACAGGQSVDSCQPGTPSTEIGDGIDNDCDGQVDEGIECAEGQTRTSTCGIGACAATGIETCVNGAWSGNTCAPGSPTAEVCDNIDNNCNGTADEGIEPVATTCGVGACASTGTTSCVNGQLVDSCQAGTPTAEVCDGIDNNCNGTADDGIAATPTTCGVGACQSTGQLACAGGQSVDSCQPGTPSTEIGDGIDNDCDGQVDEGIECAEGQTRTSTCGIGACAATGIETCVNGAWSGNTCAPGSPTAEVCDNIDNNCNGTADEGIEPVATTCGVGACASAGTSSCVNGQLVDSCQAGTPTTEVCDNIDNNCNGTADEGIEPVATTCGVGACASAGTSSCVNGQLVDSCQAGTPTTEVCDNIDNNCNGTADEGIEPVATTCGVGACASAGTSSCVNGQLVDSCIAGEPVAEVCDNADNNCDGAVDEGIASTPTTCGVGACAGNTGTASCVGGAIVDSCDPLAGASEEVCDSGVDNDCDGLADEADGLVCGPNGPPLAPANVQATDCDPVNYDPEHVNITVTWDAAEGAEYYRVHRAIYAETNTYKVVAENVTGTTFEFIQNWENDVLAIIGPTPGLSPTADFGLTTGPYPERLAFINALNAYREQALPILMDFKAPAYFKVEACNSMGCSELSAADAGSAEYTHTEQYSDLAQHLIPSWGYAQLVALADAPPGANGLTWCGIDLCGSGGGIARGRVLASGYVNIDVQYENFTEALSDASGSYFVANGSLGGSMEPAQASDGEFLLSGSFDLDIPGHPTIALDMYAHIGAHGAGDARYSRGVATLTYKGRAYQFTLPIQPEDGVSGHAAAAPSPVVPMEAIPPADWYPSEAPQPLPAVKTSRCNRVWTGYTVPQCPASVAP